MINNLTVTEDPTSVMKFSHQGTAFTQSWYVTGVSM